MKNGFQKITFLYIFHFFIALYEYLSEIDLLMVNLIITAFIIKLYPLELFIL